MKIGIQTWGSHGDIRPFIALAEGLQNSGHEVTLVITCVDNDAYTGSDLPSGVKLINVASPVISDREELAQKTIRIFNQKNPVKQIQLMIEDLFLPAEKQMYSASETLCKENDLVIAHFFHYPLNTAAQLYQKDFVSVSLVHSVVPSIYKPPAGVPNLGKLGNRLAWKLASAILNRTVKKYPDRLRQANGLAAAEDLMKNVWASQQLSLVAISPQICKQQADWPKNYQVCGFLTKPDISLEGSVDQELENFLASGEAPVFMSFGSIMSGEKIEQTLELFRDAASLAKVRAIIQSPNWKKYQLSSNQQIHFTGYTPHARVFPRCSAIVHHGGAGTTQASLLSGKPAIIVPHTAEQEFWGSELIRLGVTLNYIKRRSLTPARLAKAIKATLVDQDVIAKAKQVSLKMAGEDGVTSATILINDRFSK